MRKDVLIAGFGGQGVLLMGQLLAEAAMDDGLFVTWFPSYGPEMRGGTANCTTVFSDAEIGAPISAQYDYVIAMNQPSLEKFGPRVRPGGAIIVNSSMVPIKVERGDVAALYVPAVEIAGRLQQERVANVVMLGAFFAVCTTPSRRAYEQAINSLIGAKKPQLVRINIEALEAGCACAADQVPACV